MPPAITATELAEAIPETSVGTHVTFPSLELTLEIGRFATVSLARLAFLSIPLFGIAENAVLSISNSYKEGAIESMRKVALERLILAGCECPSSKYWDAQTALVEIEREAQDSIVFADGLSDVVNNYGLYANLGRTFGLSVDGR